MTASRPRPDEVARVTSTAAELLEACCDTAAMQIQHDADVGTRGA
ncbi:hypothetical protein [Streptomyces sp. NPDC048392]